MTVYMVRRILETGEIEWGRSYKKGGNVGKWTRDFRRASIWNEKQGPVAFLSYIRKGHKLNKSQDNCKYEIVEFDLIERK